MHRVSTPGVGEHTPRVPLRIRGRGARIWDVDRARDRREVSGKSAQRYSSREVQCDTKGRTPHKVSIGFGVRLLSAGFCVRLRSCLVPRLQSVLVGAFSLRT